MTIKIIANRLRALTRIAPRRRLLGALACLAAIAVPPMASAQNYLAASFQRPKNSRCLAGPSPNAGDPIKLVPVFPQLATVQPFHMLYSPADNQRWYVGNRMGELYTFRGANGAPVLALDIRSKVGILNQPTAFTWGGSEEWGMVSFALPPNFAQTGWLYVMYTGKTASSVPFDQDPPITRVSRFTVNGDGITFDPNSEKVLVEINNPNGWLHHGDHVAFGPDGYLYATLGDSTLNGKEYFPNVRAQDLTTVRGKMLRLDVNVTASDSAQVRARGYKIPSDNPFANGVGGLPEIFAWGFRNPWRFSFDTGRLVGAAPGTPPDAMAGIWLGDVGDATYEEVNRVVLGGNYGWNLYEGNWCRIPDKCSEPGLVPPVDIYYQNSQLAGIIGGLVYRGSAIDSLKGKYFYVIYPRSEYFAVSLNPTTGAYSREAIMPSATVFLTSMFTDPAGEIYGTSFLGTAQQVYKLVPNTDAPSSVPDLLSQTGCVAPANPKTANSGLWPFTPSSPLWSDNASKLRWLALADGEHLRIDADGDFEFPLGSVTMKRFAFGPTVHETRLLMRHTDGVWAGYSYEWNAAQTDATLVPPEGKKDKALATSSGTVMWSYPSRAECMFCHTEAAGFVLGAEVGQLNNNQRYPGGSTGNQLATLDAAGMFASDAGLNSLGKPLQELPSFPTVTNGHLSVIARVRAYMHSNCSGCHRPGNDIRANMDYRYSARNVSPTTPGAVNTTNACAVEPGLGTTLHGVDYPGAKILLPRNPNLSVMYLRANWRGSDQMPPLGTNIVHTTAMNPMAGWIRRGDVCSATVQDSDGDGLYDNADNCKDIPNASQWDADRDGYGNICDGDFDNDGAVDGSDRTLLEAAKGGACSDATFSQMNQDARYSEVYDLDGNGRINSADCSLFNAMVGRAPGPSALH